MLKPDKHEMRADPYQARARELCKADGKDPDSRVYSFVGINVDHGTHVDQKRGRPAWCDYRDAARAEHNKRETDALAESIATFRPQELKYQDRPLMVMGQDHDQSTRDQMRNCMKVGNVVGGALCADGHLGYAQSVGGIIAYEDQISVSGVGFDIACLDEETEFLHRDGWTRMDQWSGQYVAQYDPYSGCASFVQPDEYIVRPAERFLHFKTKFGIDQMLTPDHRMLVYAPGPKREFAQGRVVIAQDFADHHNSLVLGVDDRINTIFEIHHHGEVAYTDEELAVIVMTCADAYLEHREGRGIGTAILSLKKDRKIRRARQLLNLAGVPFSESGPNKLGYTTFRYMAFPVGKKLWELWGASPRQLRVIADEVLLWDGNLDAQCFYTRVKGSADFIHYAFAATGRRSVMRQDGVDYRVFAQPNTKVGLKATPHKAIKEVAATPGQKAFCFRVPTGFFVIRRGGQIAVTGNCGNMAVRLAMPYSVVKDRVSDLTREIANTISFGVGRTNDERVEHELFDDAEAWYKADREDFKGKAHAQLGTVGGGNHYVDLFEDEAGLVWIGVHFGSRGLGHSSAKKYIEAAGGKDGIHVPPTVLDLNSELGQRYLAAMSLAGRYAYAGREWVVERVRKILGGPAVVDTVHNHHNYAWLEEHNGRALWVVRKGATPAFPGQRGFVGGSMGDNAVIIEGADSNYSRAMYFSTIHGAGRLFGRKEAKRRFARPEMDAWLRDKGVFLVGGDLDESPMAYRRLPDVLSEHVGTIRVLHTLRPFSVVMAGEGEYDPYKEG